MYDHIMYIAKEPHYNRTSNGVLYMGVQISTASYIMEEEDMLSCKDLISLSSTDTFL